jgi:CheY-like chemotaxis protein
VLLDVSRLDGGMVKPHPEMIAVQDLLGTIETEFAPLALAKGLRFKLFFPRETLMVHADVMLLQGLLRNLVDNALKYTESGGILVGIRRRGDRVLIQVWDTGIGVAAEHLGAIFDEYFQVSNPQRDSTKGLGLGLAIVKRVADILGGSVACRSRPAQGSVFELSLALVLQPEEPQPILGARAGGAASAGLDGVRIAVIEDDAMAAKAVEIALGACGMRIQGFASAEEALADPDIATADFYIADFRLPGMNGVQLLNEIQRLAGRPIRATLLTGETFGAAPADPGLSTKWKILVKPVDLAAMVAEIRAQLPQADTANVAA